jgi:adenylate cyclase
MVVRAGRFYAILVVAVLAGATALRIADPFLLQALRFIAFDSYQRLAPQAYNPDYPVRIVDIDEESLARIGQWPWPRTVIADLVGKLAGQGASAIGFDILFSEPDQTSPEVVIERLGPGFADAIKDQYVFSDSHDAIFAKAIAAAPVVLAAALTNRVADGPGLPQKAGFAIAGDDPAPFVASFSGATGNLAALDQAAAGIGSINWVPDRDQVIRRVPLVYREGGEFVPALAAEALRVAQGASTYILKASNASGETAFGETTGLNHIKVGDIEVPTDADGGIWLQFRHSNPAAFIPAWKVLAGENDAGEVAGRIVLVGTSAPGLLDLRATPLDPAVPGVEVHAMAIEHILSGLALTRPDYALAAEIVLFLALGLLVSLVLPRISAASSAAVGIVVVAGLFAGGWFLYRDAGLLFDPTFPALSLAVLVGAATLTIYRKVEEQRREVRRAFGYYVAPAVVDEIIADPGRLELGGEVRELTLLFCDVRNFTAISERMSAHELTQFINSLLTPLSKIILSERGTIDKYMGDAIMAFWNAPLDDPDHAGHAARAALQMAAAMDGLNRRWKAEAAAAGRPFHKVAIGIGINTGECCVGNLGSEQRFDYSAIGDNVNIASRYEGLCKLYGVPTVVGEATVREAKDVDAIELDLIRVKGRGEPTRVFTLAGAIAAAPDALARLKPLHAAMLAAYRSRDFDGALGLIERCRRLGIEGLDTLFTLYRTRVLTYREIPPPDDWDGADTAVTK